MSDGLTVPSEYFNPPTPWGVGRTQKCAHSHARDFNPPTPWGVGLSTRLSTRFATHFNPPTPWGVGHRNRRSHVGGRTFQSTHSVGSGTGRGAAQGCPRTISIHPLRGEWDKCSRKWRQKSSAFQSTHSVGSGTGGAHGKFSGVLHFNPPTPWGVGLRTTRHLPRAARFQSTHSVGSGTHISDLKIYDNPFQSTHSVGSGTTPSKRSKKSVQFQSTHSVGSGTPARICATFIIVISIHPLRGEWD